MSQGDSLAPNPANSAGQLTEHLAGLLAEPMAEMGYDVEAVEVSSAGKRRVVRIALDTDGGISLDDVAAATREINALLDAEEGDRLLGSKPYTLEVTSRGVDRPLTLPRHWRRNVGRLVKVRLADDATVTGRIVASDDGGADLDVSGTTHHLTYGEITKALVQIEFKRADDTSADDPSDTSADDTSDDSDETEEN